MKFYCVWHIDIRWLCPLFNDEFTRRYATKLSSLKFRWVDRCKLSRRQSAWISKSLDKIEQTVSKVNTHTCRLRLSHKYLPFEWVNVTDWSASENCCRLSSHRRRDKTRRCRRSAIWIRHKAIAYQSINQSINQYLFVADKTAQSVLIDTATGRIDRRSLHTLFAHIFWRIWPIMIRLYLGLSV